MSCTDPPGIMDDMLTARLRRGEEAAFRQAYECYNSRLYGFAYRFLKNPEDSEEVVQEAFLHLWESRGKLDAACPLGPYLFTIARRLTLNMLRKTANSRQAYGQYYQAVIMDNHDTEEMVLSADLRQLIREALSKLSPQQRRIFCLSREEGLSHEEIALRMHLSRNTVKNHMVTALKKLRICLQQHPVTYLLLLSFMEGI